MMIVFANPTDVACADQAAAGRPGTVVRLAAVVPAGRMFVLTEEQAERAGDGSTLERLAHEVLVAEPAERPRRQKNQFQRRARRWSRTGSASAFGTDPGDGSSGVGWSWEIRRDGSEHRRVRVEVSTGPCRVTDLPAEARNAIRSRGASAVDAFLETDDPPVRIVVSTQGLQAHYTGPRASD
jgi:hypothetical protein